MKMTKESDKEMTKEHPCKCVCELEKYIHKKISKIYITKLSRFNLIRTFYLPMTSTVYRGYAASTMLRQIGRAHV